MHHFDYIIVGNSAAGVSAARTLRQLDAKSSIALIGKDSPLTFNTCLFGDVLKQKKSFSEIIFYSSEQAVHERIELIISTVEKIKVVPNEITGSGGRAFSYKKLLLATGTQPSVPDYFRQEADLAFLVYHTANDISRIDEHIKKNGVQKAFVIGGGVNGIECVAALASRGLVVHIIESKRILSHLPFSTATWAKNYLESRSITVTEHGDTSISFRSFNKNSMTILATGVRPSLRADMFGHQPQWYGKSNFLLVDEQFKTSLPHIYAAGDAIYRQRGQNIDPTPFLWSSAVYQGIAAAHIMAGKNFEYSLARVVQKIDVGERHLYVCIPEMLSSPYYLHENYDMLNYHAEIFDQNNMLRGFITTDPVQVARLRVVLTSERCL